MRILYITPTIYDEGGVARVLSLKSEVFIEKYQYEIGFLTYNNNVLETFHPFHSEIKKFDIKSKGFKLFKILNYYKKVGRVINEFKPNIIVVCDFGWKGLFLRKFIKTTIPIIFEVHGSLYNETRKIKNSTFLDFRARVRRKLLSSYENIVFLSEVSQQEWKLNGEIIPNPVADNNLQAELVNPKAIAIARHSYEKGVDRLIVIWAKVAKKSNWKLEIYGEGYLFNQHLQQIKNLCLENQISLHKPIRNIQDKYFESSLFLMTSRTEGFPMSLLEAMSTGLPVVAYNCPVGPKAIINNEVSGFLIEDNNENDFIEKVILLQNNEELRKQIGEKSKEQIRKLNPKIIGQMWFNYFTSLTSKS